MQSKRSKLKQSKAKQSKAKQSKLSKAKQNKQNKTKLLLESGPPGPKRVPHGRPVKQTNKQTKTQELPGELPLDPRQGVAPGPHPLKLRGMPLARYQRTLQISPLTFKNAPPALNRYGSYFCSFTSWNLASKIGYYDTRLLYFKTRYAWMSYRPCKKVAWQIRFCCFPFCLFVYWSVCLFEKTLIIGSALSWVSLSKSILIFWC